MNINNLKPEIEMLKEESAPAHLKARIVKALLDENKSKNMTTKKIIGFGLPAIALGAIVFGTAMAPRTAMANPINQVRDALGAVHNYKMTTFQYVEGKRTKITESWVEKGERTTFTVNDDGSLTELPREYVTVQKAVQGVLIARPPVEVAKGEELKEEISILIVEGKPRKPKETQNSTEPVEVQVRQAMPVEGKRLIKNVEGKEGIVIELQITPFIDAEMSIEALQRLLEDKTLWDIEPDSTLEGKQVLLYKLKQTYMDFSVFVNSQSKLPILTRQILKNEDGTLTTTEVEYEYDQVIPPVLAERAKPTIIPPRQSGDTKK